jgi:4a-hydroxytetrahydrobiopterin dehydratase
MAPCEADLGDPGPGRQVGLAFRTWHHQVVTTRDPQEALSRTAASDAVEAIGWRYLLGTLAVSVPVDSMKQANDVAGAAISVCGEDADSHLRVDLRSDRVELSLQTRARAVVTPRDAELAHRISTAFEELGLRAADAVSSSSPRPVEMLELAIDAIDIPSIRPFWKAVLAYSAEAQNDGPTDAIVDPTGQLPAIWFQQMDEPRPQRNRIHFDITVAHDEAEARVRAALEAGGHMVDDSYARAFWVLADKEGNEVCVCTWTDRDERGY